VHDESGTVFCYDTASTPCVRHPMAYIGHEPGRGTLKYRCPAATTAGPAPTTAHATKGGITAGPIRIKQELDLRRFPAIPRATKQFERLYRGRTAVERVNARLKLFWGADDGNITGARRFHAFVGAVMVVHVAFATLLRQHPDATAPWAECTSDPFRKPCSRRSPRSNEGKEDAKRTGASEKPRPDMAALP